MKCLSEHFVAEGVLTHDAFVYFRIGLTKSSVQSNIDQVGGLRIAPPTEGEIIRLILWTAVQRPNAVPTILAGTVYGMQLKRAATSTEYPIPK